MWGHNLHAHISGMQYETEIESTNFFAAFLCQTNGGLVTGICAKLPLMYNADLGMTVPT